MVPSVDPPSAMIHCSPDSCCSRIDAAVSRNAARQSNVDVMMVIEAMASGLVAQQAKRQRQLEVLNIGSDDHLGITPTCVAQQIGQATTVDLAVGLMGWVLAVGHALA